jgi:hypothetical protein
MKPNAEDGYWSSIGAVRRIGDELVIKRCVNIFPKLCGIIGLYYILSVVMPKAAVTD